MDSNGRWTAGHFVPPKPEPKKLSPPTPKPPDDFDLYDSGWIDT
jgi:hypothetical protein